MVKIQAAEMRFLRRVKGCTRADRIRNVDIRAELNIYSINNRLEEYKEIRKQYFTISTKRKKRYRPSEEEMEINKEKKMKSEQAVLPNPCLKEEELQPYTAAIKHSLKLKPQV